MNDLDLPHVQALGTAFMEFSSPKPDELLDILRRVGFRIAGRSPAGDAWWMRQGGVNFVVNAAAGSHAAAFAEQHGPSCVGMAFRVQDSDAAVRSALAHGARRHTGAAEALLPGVALSGIGGSALYLVDKPGEFGLWKRFVETTDADPTVDSPFSHVDHVTHCVNVGHMDEWVDFYKRIFGFVEVFKFVAGDARNGFDTVAVRDPGLKACVTVLEPMGRGSQIQEFIDEYKGEGIQHIALASDDLYTTARRLKDEGVEFLPTPNAYYDAIETRLPEHGEDIARMRELGLLIDGAATGENPDERSKLLLQVFTRKLIGPIFLEAIQRKGNPGFGEGNAVALFEAIKREQDERAEAPETTASA